MAKWSDRPMGNCCRCYYFSGGKCHRYPATLEKEEMDFCGEFVRDPSFDPLHNTPSNYAEKW